MITDCKTTGLLEHWALYAKYQASAAITRGRCVTLGTDGQITTAATDSLQKVIGVAAEDIPSGGVGKVLVFGFCDYIYTADTITAPTDAADGDVVLVAINGGGVEGRVATDLNDNSVQGNMIVAKNLGANVDNVAYGWVVCQSGTYAKDVA